MISTSGLPQGLRVILAELLQSEFLLAEYGAALPAQAVLEQRLPEELQQAGQVPAGVHLLQTEDVGVVCVDHLDHSVKVTGAVSVHPAVNVVGGDLNTSRRDILQELKTNTLLYLFG